MEKKIEFKNVEKINESAFKTKLSINIPEMLQNGEIIFITNHPEGVKRAERVSCISKIEVDANKVNEIADQINMKMKCQDCGKECFDDKCPEVVFKDECYCICENCSINYYKDSNGKIKLRERF